MKTTTKGNKYWTYIPCATISGTTCYGNTYISSTVTSTGGYGYYNDPIDLNGDGVFDKEDLKYFEKRIKKTLKDGHEVEVTIGEYYEINKMGKKLEDLTIEEYGDIITAIRL